MVTPSGIFEGINALAQLLIALGVCGGVWVAHRQLQAWRIEHVSKRRSEISEGLLSVALNTQRAFRAVRSAMEHVPQGSDNTQDAIIDLKLERLNGYRETFDRLRELQVLYDAFNDNPTVSDAVEELFDCQQELYAALATLRGWNLNSRSTEEDISFHEDLRLKIYGIGARRDTFGPEVQNSIDTLREHLLSEIRMNS